MIYLLTGLPGSGKTQYTLQFVQKLAGESGRHVYQAGIKFLTLPWVNMLDHFAVACPDDAPEDRYDEAYTAVARRWHELPEGSIIVLDECQRLFRNRSIGQHVPEFVSRLETHRHHGYDIVLISQHPMNIDNHVRRLVERHLHLIRPYGRQKADIYEFKGCQPACDDPKALKNATRSEFAYDKKLFALYKSAEVHTHKLRIPREAFFLILLLFVLLGCVGGFFWWVKNRALPPTVAPVPVKPDSKSPALDKFVSGSGFTGGSRPADKKLTLAERRAEFVESFTPMVPGMPYSAPAYVEITKPVRAPAPVACVMSDRQRCTCYSQQGTKLVSVHASMCEAIVREGFYMHWDDRPLQAAPSQVGAAAKPPEGAGGAPSKLFPVPPVVPSLPAVPADPAPAQVRAPAGALAFPRMP